MKQDSTLALEKQITDWLKLFDAGSSLTEADISPSTRWGGRGKLYPTLHCHHHSDSCITMGSDESHFNVSLIVRGS